MKKILATIMLLATLLALVGCAGRTPIQTPQMSRAEIEEIIRSYESTELLEETIPEVVELATTEPTTAPTQSIPAFTTSPGSKQETIKPTEPTPTPTEPEETTTEPETIPTEPEAKPTEPETTTPAPTEPEKTHELVTKYTVINGMSVAYLVCGDCERETTHENVMWGGTIITRKIQSITVVNNSVCKVVLVPRNDGLTSWTCYITNKTGEQLEMSSTLVSSIIAPGETKTRTFSGSISNAPIVSGFYHDGGQFTSDGRVCAYITINMTDFY